MDSPSDEALLSRYRSGDGAAFEALYARHRQGLYRFLVSLSNKAELAEEVLGHLAQPDPQHQRATGPGEFSYLAVPDCPQPPDRPLAQARHPQPAARQLR